MKNKLSILLVLVSFLIQAQVPLIRGYKLPFAVEDNTNTDKRVPILNTNGVVNSYFNHKPQEFIKNGLGWSLRYKQDNPDKYVITGENAVDLTKAYPDSQINFGASGKDAFAVGAYNLAAGLNSISMGYSTRAYGTLTNVISYNSIAYSPFSSIFGGYRNTIGYEELLTTPIASLNTRTTIVGGADNKILRTQFSSIIGGSNNTIDAGENYVANTTAYNNIIGGYNNQIIKSSSRSNILGGENNISQGWYNNVSGLENHAVTLGETIFGTYATIQDINLPPNEFGNQNSTNRIFSVGIGGLIDNTSYRADGLNIYKNGLVTAPSLTSALINSNPKALITKEYFDDNQNNVIPTFQQVLDNGLATATINKTFDITSNNFTINAGSNANIGGGTTFILSGGANVNIDQGSRVEMNQGSSMTTGNNGQVTLQSGPGKIELLSEMVGARDESFVVNGISPIIKIDKDIIDIKNKAGVGLEIPSTINEGYVLTSDANGVFKPAAPSGGGGGNFVPLSGSTSESPLTGGLYLSNDNSSDVIYSEKPSTVNLFNHKVSSTEYSKIFSGGGSGLFLEYTTPYNNNELSRLLLGGSTVQLTSGDNTISFTPDYFLNNSFRINKNGRVIADGLSIPAIDDPAVGNSRVLITKEYLQRGIMTIELTTDLTLNLSGMGREETIIYNTPTSPTRTVTLPSGAKSGQKIKIMNISEEPSADIQVIFNGKSVSCLSDTNNKGSLDIIFLNGTWLYQYEQYRPIDLEIVEP